MDAILPWTIWRGLHIAKRLPHSTIALEATPEGNLPNPVALPHPPLCLSVSKLIPDGAGGRVAKPVQGHPGSLHMVWPELQILL